MRRLEPVGAAALIQQTEEAVALLNKAADGLSYHSVVRMRLLNAAELAQLAIRTAKLGLPKEGAAHAHH